MRKVKRIKLGKEVYRRLMKRVLERDGWRCQKRGSLENLQIHHKTKRSQLGSDFPGNLAESHLRESLELARIVPLSHNKEW